MEIAIKARMSSDMPRMFKYFFIMFFGLSTMHMSESYASGVCSEAMSQIVDLQLKASNIAKPLKVGSKFFFYSSNSGLGVVNDYPTTRSLLSTVSMDNALSPFTGSTQYAEDRPRTSRTVKESADAKFQRSAETFLEAYDTLVNQFEIFIERQGKNTILLETGEDTAILSLHESSGVSWFKLTFDTPSTFKVEYLGGPDRKVHEALRSAFVSVKSEDSLRVVSFNLPKQNNADVKQQLIEAGRSEAIMDSSLLSLGSQGTTAHEIWISDTASSGDTIDALMIGGAMVGVVTAPFWFTRLLELLL